MALNFGSNNSDFTFSQSKSASQGLNQTKRIETASIVVAADESGDFTSIQEAINALNGEGGFIQVKEGLFYPKSKINVPNNVTIRGVGYNTQIVSTFSGEVFENEDITGGNENIEISDLRIKAYSGTGIRLKNCDSCELKNNKFESFTGIGASNYGILIEDSTKILLESNKSLDVNYGYGIVCNNMTFSNVIKNNMFGENISINLIDCENSIISNNQCNDAGDIGINLDSDCVLINVTNNNVSNSGNVGIDHSGSYCIIHGNCCDNAFSTGIVLNAASDNSIITENMATISLGGTANTVTNNKNI